ncbi:MAG: hypothetical protein CME31_22960 [Gimesia sp.]|jgi:hypothetical protein|uniref:Peptidase MA-like domain-containing protein n=1 Tax=Gimesia maris TaxID=122 RepID=A0A3D3RHD0_9PLAN|nr:hypothetical protein [Gimesia sp.]HCO27447.1 hypothetical protein [Gimesia maris]|tara:strand:+ start:69172 stop:70374 length:1203 start_codon:yes stop_codon:yes gene_type:complete
MEAQISRCLVLFLASFISLGASYKTPNFVTHAPTAEVAKQVGDAAEIYRKELAITWLGHELPKWFSPCPIKVKVGNYGAGGATTFSFDGGEVFGWNMEIQGSLERILDSVLPHEVNHTIFACHFRRPLPRWADEGAATIVEHESEKRRQRLLNRQVMGTNKRIPLRNLLSMTEYPSEMQQVLTLYAEGYSLADYLLQTGGKKRYLMFLEDAHKNGWDEAIAKMYKIKNVEALEQRWGSWIMAGSPALNLPAGQQLAAVEPKQPSAVDNKDFVIRSQSPDQVEADFATEMPGQTQLASAEPTEEMQRESRPLPIESRIPFSGRPAEKRHVQESVAFVPDAKRLPRTSLHQDSTSAPQSRPQPAARFAQPKRSQQRPANRYNRGANPARGGIDLGQSAEIDF